MAAVYRVEVVVVLTNQAATKEVACSSAESLVREHLRSLPTPAHVEWIGCEEVARSGQ